MTYYTFYRISYHHEHRDTVLNDILRYSDPSAGIMVCLETSTNKNTHKKTNGEHYHICVENPFDWKNYRNTILVNKYKLIGKATKDQPSEYCLTHKVKDEDRFKVYMVKEKNKKNIYRNIDFKTIQDYISRSFEKVERKSFNDSLMHQLESQMTRFVTEDYKVDITQIEKDIIEFIILHGFEAKMSCSRSRVTAFATQFLLYHLCYPHYGYDDVVLPSKMEYLSDQRYHYIMYGTKNSM